MGVTTTAVNTDSTTYILNVHSRCEAIAARAQKRRLHQLIQLN